MILLADARFRHVEEHVPHAVRATVGALDQQNRDELVFRIDPALRSEGAAVTVRSLRMSGQFAERIGDHFPRETVIGAEHPADRMNAGGVRFRHEVNRERREITAAFVDAVIEHHAIKMQQVFGGRIEAPSRRGKHRPLPIFRGIAA